MSSNEGAYVISRQKLGNEHQLLSIVRDNEDILDAYDDPSRLVVLVEVEADDAAILAAVSSALPVLPGYPVEQFARVDMSGPGVFGDDGKRIKWPVLYIPAKPAFIGDSLPAAMALAASGTPCHVACDSPLFDKLEKLRDSFDLPGASRGGYRETGRRFSDLDVMLAAECCFLVPGRPRFTIGYSPKVVSQRAVRRRDRRVLADIRDTTSNTAAQASSAKDNILHWVCDPVLAALSATRRSGYYYRRFVVPRPISFRDWRNWTACRSGRGDIPVWSLADNLLDYRKIARAFLPAGSFWSLPAVRQTLSRWRRVRAMCLDVRSVESLMTRFSALRSIELGAKRRGFRHVVEPDEQSTERVLLDGIRFNERQKEPSRRVLRRQYRLFRIPGCKTEFVHIRHQTITLLDAWASRGG